MKLGRKAVKRDSRMLLVANYLTAVLPAPPPSVDWSKGQTFFGSMYNNTLGCCTIAGAGHAVQILSANAGAEATVSDNDILKYYEQWDGYNPADPSTDQGGIELDVLNKWKAQGFAGHALDAYADVNVKNVTEIKQAINLFGGLYIGMEVPNFIMASIPTVWDVTANDGGIDGGHCVFVYGYDATGPQFISWGSVYTMTWAFWAKYVDEAHALLSPDFLGANGLDPEGFNLAQLQADLADIK